MCIRDRANMQLECLDVCRNEGNCIGEKKEAALLLMESVRCKDSVNIFKSCCEGNKWITEIYIIRG